MNAIFRRIQKGVVSLYRSWIARLAGQKLPPPDEIGPQPLATEPFQALSLAFPGMLGDELRIQARVVSTRETAVEWALSIAGLREDR